MTYELKTRTRYILITVFAVSVALFIIFCGLIYSHNRSGWTNVHYLELHENLFASIIVISLITIFFTKKWLDGPYHNSDDFYEDMLFIVAMSFFCLFTLAVPASVSRNTEINAFKPSVIECVYADNGTALNAKIKYHVSDGTASERTCVYTGKELGYTDVVVDDKITNPEERVLPAGTTLVVPQSYMKKEQQKQ